jgi:hypothetical protein
MEKLKELQKHFDPNHFDPVYAFYNIINTVELDPVNIKYYVIFYVKFYYSIAVASSVSQPLQIIYENKSYFYYMYHSMGIHNNRNLYSYMFLDSVYERIKVYDIIFALLSTKDTGRKGQLLIKDHLRTLVDFLI